jgi:hypothetical protein
MCGDEIDVQMFKTAKVIIKDTDLTAGTVFEVLG